LRKVAAKSSKSRLATETVESSALALESIDNVHSSDGLAAGVLSVGDGIANNVLEEDLENTTSLLIDQTRDTLDTTTTSETSNGGLGNALNVVTQHLAVTLGTRLAEALASLATTSTCSGGRHLLLELLVV
jgi:hypothetical protein